MKWSLDHMNISMHIWSTIFFGKKRTNWRCKCMLSVPGHCKGNWNGSKLSRVMISQQLGLGNIPSSSGHVFVVAASVTTLGPKVLKAFVPDECLFGCVAWILLQQDCNTTVRTATHPRNAVICRDLLKHHSQCKVRSNQIWPAFCIVKFFWPSF